MKTILVWMLGVIGAMLLVGCDSSSGGGSSSSTGTYVIDEYGTELVDVIVSGEPFPQPSTDADRPVIDEVEWLEHGEQIILRVTVLTDYPLLSLHLEVDDVHYIVPTEAWRNGFAEQSLCDFVEDGCTQGCLDAGSCFQDCDAEGYSPDPVFNLSDTEMVQQQFAISCSIQANGGSIGPGLTYETESHFLNEMWLGDNGDPAFDGLLAGIDATCDTSDCPLTTIGGERTETHDTVINPPQLEVNFPNMEFGAIVVESQPPNRDRGTLTSDGLTGATLDPCVTGSTAIRNRC